MMDKDKMKYLRDRPLTEEEKAFSEENYNMFLWYVRRHRLDQEEIDALIIPYLTVVKKYLSIPRLQQYRFSTIFVKQMDNYRKCYYKNRYSKKHMPEGGIYSLDYTISNDDGKEGRIEARMIDRSIDIERQFIDQEVFQEFLEVVDRLPKGEQNKTVLYLLLEKYTEKEIIKYINARFPSWKFDRKRLNLILRSLHFAFRESGLDALFPKTSLCKTLYYDILECAIKEKIIKRQGARLLYNGVVIGKGRDEGKIYLESHQLDTNEIVNQLRSKYLRCE
jgi:hypothetical protein